jgi:GAF domain-containing protein
MELHRTLSAMALELEQKQSLHETLQAVSEYARTTLDADEAGVMYLRSGGRIETPFGTSSVVEDAHQLQARFGEGPCLDAVDGQATYLTDDTEQDPRWPRWGPAAADLGVRSAVGIRLATASRGYGSLNVYAQRLGAFTDEHAALAQVLAAHVTAAIAMAERVEGLTTALDSRTVIGQAQGILMQTFGIDADAAFSVLRRISQHENVRLNALAEAIATQRNADARPPSPR